MSNLILVFICLMLGLAFQRVKRIPENASASLNAYVIYVALPALVLNEIPKLSLNRQALLLVGAAWIIMAFSAAITWFAGRALGWSREVMGALLLTVTLGNTGFVGIPLIEAHLGQGAISYAILYDQFGTFLALNTLGVAVASYFGKGGATAEPFWRNIVRFPPFIALWVALLFSWVGYPGWFADILPRISSTLVPVVMVAVGLQWRLRLEREYLQPLLVGMAFILLVTPAFAWGLVWLMGIEGLARQVVILEAAMPAMISAGVLAIAHNLVPRLASALVGYSLMVSLLSVWLWRLLIN